jgi:hypothetical protein
MVAQVPRQGEAFRTGAESRQLFRMEICENRPCALPSTYVRHIDHSYTKLYRDPEYVITGQLADMRNDKRNDIQKDVDFLVSMVSAIPKRFPQLKSARPEDRQTLCESAELKICHHVDYVQVQATELVTWSPYFVGESLPAIDKTWITFRWF